MKMMKRTLLMAAAVLALAACSDDDGPDGPQLVTETVTFEDATLNTSGILTGEKLAEEVTGDTGTYKEYSGTFYTSGTASFQCYYSDQWGSSYTAGFTVSNNTNMETPGFGNQYSVYAKGGAKEGFQEVRRGLLRFVQCFAGKGGSRAGGDLLEEGQPAEHLDQQQHLCFPLVDFG